MRLSEHARSKRTHPAPLDPAARSAPQPSAAASASAYPQALPPPRLAFVLFRIYVFLVFSRIQEFFLPIPKLLLVIGVLAAAITFVSAGPPRALASRMGWLVTAFGMCMALSVPFSMWPGGSLKILLAWMPYLLLFIVGAQLLTTVEAIRRTMYTIALATLFVMLLSFGVSTQIMGRISLGEGTIGDPNDMANFLLFGSPCIILILLDSQGNWLRKIFHVLGLALILVSVLRTGSRAGLIALIVLTLVAVGRLPHMSKVLFLVGAVIVALLAYALLPTSITVRYKTLLEDAQDTSELSREESAARGSTEGRMILLKQSIKISARHPFLGVGAGQFILANNADYVEQNLRSPWKVSHNSYTQVSSELGIPGFLAYMAILITGFSTTGRLWNALKKRLRTRTGRRLGVLRSALPHKLLRHVFFLDTCVPVLCAYLSRSGPCPWELGQTASQRATDQNCWGTGQRPATAPLNNPRAPSTQ